MDEVVHLVGNPGEMKTMWVHRPSKVKAVGEEHWDVTEPGDEVRTARRWRIETRE